MWKHRLMLEAMLHSENCFVTLTYADQFLSNVYSVHPKQEGVLLPSLNPVHLQKFMKRLRKRVDSPLRFFAVGEYGDKSWRPHYHAVIYGMKTCERGRTRRIVDTNVVSPLDCCDVCRLVSDVWSMGLIELGQANVESMGYVSGYVLKGIFNDKSDRLRGRFPEFSRKSNRPGIGAGFMDVLADSLVEYGVGKDVPCALAHGESKFPLTRYLRNKLRVLIGREEGCPDEILFEMAQTMREMREISGVRNFEDWKVFAVSAVNAGAANVRAKSEIFAKRRTI